jgi:hypothetical protein
VGRFAISWKKIFAKLSARLPAKVLVSTRHERDWFFDLSCPIKMNKTVFKKIPFLVNLVLFNLKIPLPFVEQKLPFNDWTGPDQW